MTKDEIREIIRTNLINLRTSYNLTQAELGKKVDKSKTAVASWEQGLSIPDATTLYELSKIYNVNLDYFYEKHTVASVSVVNDNYNKMSRDLEKKNGHGGIPRQATGIHPARRKYSTQPPKVPPTLKILAVDDDGETRVVEINSAALVASPTIIKSPHSSLEDIPKIMNKKEGGVSD